MKIRMQIQGSEVRLNGPVEGLQRVVEACASRGTKIYDTDYEEIVFTRFHIVERYGYLVESHDGPLVARRLSELEAERMRVDQHNRKQIEESDEKANDT